MAVQQHVAASIFDINLGARTAALVCLAILATVLTIVPTGQAQTLTVLHAFSGLDGDLPFAGLTLDRAGNLYGTTYQGGAAGFGNVFKLSHEGSGWVLSNLYSFQGGRDGEHPQARVVFGPDGTLYGTTTNGGNGNGFGTVFNLRPSATICRAIQCPWTETVLYRFTGGTDGRYPQYGDLTFDAAGNLYGTTAYGGDPSCNRSGGGCGVVFELSRSGGGWTESVLYAFPGAPESGAEPFSGVTFDSAGNLFGTTFLVDSTVYELSPSGSGWTQTILHTLSGDDGAYPIGGVAFDQQGNLYGTTDYGGNGIGTVFQLQPANGNWNFNLLYNWGGGPGPGPTDTPTLDAAGNVYGTTSGGITGFGGVFKLTPGANGWTYTDLYDFGDPHLSDGFTPLGGVVLDGNGNLYGTTSEGGNFNPPCGEGCGVVWEMTP